MTEYASLQELVDAIEGDSFGLLHRAGGLIKRGTIAPCFELKPIAGLIRRTYYSCSLNIVPTLNGDTWWPAWADIGVSEVYNEAYVGKAKVADIATIKSESTLTNHYELGPYDPKLGVTTVYEWQLGEAYTGDDVIKLVEFAIPTLTTGYLGLKRWDNDPQASMVFVNRNPNGEELEVGRIFNDKLNGGFIRAAATVLFNQVTQSFDLAVSLMGSTPITSNIKLNDALTNILSVSLSANPDITHPTKVVAFRHSASVFYATAGPNSITQAEYNELADWMLITGTQSRFQDIPAPPNHPVPSATLTVGSSAYTETSIVVEFITDTSSEFVAATPAPAPVPEPAPESNPNPEQVKTLFPPYDRTIDLLSMMQESQVLDKHITVSDNEGEDFPDKVTVSSPTPETVKLEWADDVVGDLYAYFDLKNTEPKWQGYVYQGTYDLIAEINASEVSGTVEWGRSSSHYGTPYYLDPELPIIIDTDLWVQGQSNYKQEGIWLSGQAGASITLTKATISKKSS